MNFRGGNGARARRTAAVVDITALIDVVFQLLIFFLLTSSYVSQARSSAPQIPVELPESSLEATAQPARDFNIVVKSTGEIFVGDEEQVSIEELAVRLARAQAENPKTVILIRGDQTVAYGRIAQVMTVARSLRLPISAVLRNP